MSRDNVHPYSFGTIWHAIDTELAVRHSHLSAETNWGSPDLRRYNVLVLPGTIASWDDSFLKSMRPWLESGGTVIAVGNSAFQIAGDSTGPSKVRLLRNVLDKLDDYEVAVHRDWQASQKTIPSVASIFAHGAGSEGPSAWDASFTRPKKDALERDDKWRRLFMPAGAPIIAGRTNPEHWLTFGTGESIGVLHEGSQVMMAQSDVESAVRVGVPSPNEDAEATRVGWSSIPAGFDLFIRQSGLLWPEAAQRLANAPLVTREAVGKGQIILIGFEPNFRGTTAETKRLLFNAMVLGPGFGTTAVVKP
jgi:hypothetical protein